MSSPQRSFSWAGGMVQGVEHLPRKHEALSSNSNIAKKKKKEDGYTTYSDLICPYSIYILKYHIIYHEYKQFLHVSQNYFNLTKWK
jgi:hypothetical protein